MKKNFIHIGVVALTTALALSSCASSGDAAKNTGELDPDAVLSVGVNVMETSWDPARSVGVAGMPVTRLVFDGLLALDKDTNVVPELAESFDTSDGGKTYKFILREDVKFSNGDTFDAKDAKATLDRYRNFEASTLKGELANVESIIVDSPTELTIVQKSADVTLPVYLAQRSGIMMSEDAIAEGDFENPVGSGMFTLKANSPGVSSTFEKNPDYWDNEEVKVAGVVVKKMEDTTARANALRSGDLDMGLVGANQAIEIEAASGLESFAVEGRALRGMTFNPNLYEPLKDERVRRALSIGINREGIAAGVLLGEAQPANQFVPQGHKFYSEQAPKIEYNPEEAKRLLAEAGHSNDIKFTMTAPPKYQKEAEAIQADWEAIGVQVELTFPTGSGNAEKIWYNKEVPVGLWAFEGRGDLGAFYSTLFDSDSAYNPSGQADKEFATLVDLANSTPDEAERKAVFEDLAQIVGTKTQNQFPIVFGYDIVAYSDALTGVQEWQAGFPYVKGIAKTK